MELKMFDLKKILYTFMLLSLACYNTVVPAFESGKLLHDVAYHICFTPGNDCTQLIVDTLSGAQKSIFIQAYSFTSVPIAKAVVEAKRKGIPVYVILDKSQSPKNRYSSAKYLLDNNVETYIDYKPAIAHNKVIIIDGKILITGSFNFTKAAQMHNAENLIIIANTDIAKIYLANWYDRREKSMLATDYQRYRYGIR
jgi:phosphatidylserine/phosphatidylglycerophosphate/cardiolipin synthase-like enzyme